MTHLLWTQKQDVGPSARGNAAMAFDSTKNRTLLFGGTVGSTGAMPMSDTWEWDGDNWVTPETAILPTAYINKHYGPFSLAMDGAS